MVKVVEEVKVLAEGGGRPSGARERIETAPEPRMVSQKDYDDTIAAAKERMLALSAWSKRNPGATYEDAKKIFVKGDKLFANKD